LDLKAIGGINRRIKKEKTGMLFGVPELESAMQRAADAAVEDVLGVTITALIDNALTKPGLGSIWGLSFHVKVHYAGRDDIILFDLGGSPQVFRHNVQALGLDLAETRAVVISHFHTDHYGALETALEHISSKDCVTYLPGVNEDVESIVAAADGRLVTADESEVVGSGISTTSALGTKSLKEHGLVINTAEKGIILLTGCAHPGLDRIAGKARKIFPDRPFHAILGGFHINTRDDGEQLAQKLAKMDVQFIAPCHCTGKEAKQALREAFGDSGYWEIGTGSILEIR
jgi:7,8-dihydropterin-6-yl-methyl-4-(beta-D-ribofuranosyl)aminobenzene 5'-phosphate synthase